MKNMKTIQENPLQKLMILENFLEEVCLEDFNK